MRIVRPDWYGLIHEKVSKRFEGNPTFVNEFCVRDEYRPSAVYRSPHPNRDKGHKDYLLLTVLDDRRMVVRGMDRDEIEPYRYQEAIHCLGCDDVVYSCMRHDMRSCSCGSVSIDGGRDYVKVSFEPGAEYEMVRLDLLENLISPDEPEDRSFAV